MYALKSRNFNASTHPALRPPGLHPLIRGNAKRDRHLVTQLLNAWADEGFEQVAPTQIDDAQRVFSNQNHSVQRRAFRFLDPETGEMLALLPDVTLGIARLATGELASEPRPLNLSYEGQAIRATGSTARPVRQFGQVGVEVIGIDRAAPLRLMSLALKSLTGLGITDLHISLVLPPLAGALIAPLGLEANQATALAEALDRKDEGTIKSLAGLAADKFLKILDGDLDQDPALKPLKDLQTDLVAAVPGVQVRCEPFEQRGFAIQDGPAFALYSASYQGELGRGGTYRSGGEDCFGFTLYRDALLAAIPQAPAA